MTTIRNFLQWCNDKVVVPALVSMQKMVEVYHDKELGIKKLSFTLQIYQNQSAQIG